MVPAKGRKKRIRPDRWQYRKGERLLQMLRAL